MKRFIHSLLLFIPCSIVIYILLIILWGDYAPRILEKNLNYKIGAGGHMYSRLQDIHRTSNIDILILGSSHAYRGYDPRIFNKHGFSMFNLGSSAQSPIQTKVLTI